MKNIKKLVIVVSLAFLPIASYAAELMPDFSLVPAGWNMDRYDPASFSNVGTFQGRNNVLGISIDTTGDLANRPAGFQTTFYNTQGRQHGVSGGAGSIISADLFVPSTWADARNGYVRTDMWGVTSGPGGPDYPIIGFSNFGTGARFRVWDSDLNGGLGDWVNLATPISYNSWNALSINFTGSSYVYSVNGSTVFTDTQTHGDGFNAVIMEAYNFADPSLGSPTPTTVPYTAYWANKSVPDAGATWALMSMGLIAVAGLRSRFGLK